MIVNSFGCSFTYGTDLPDDGQGRLFAAPSKFTWPALIAQKLNAQYTCHAYPGAGNLYILEKLLSHAALGSDDLCIVNWTWMDRFDYVGATDRWSSLVPADTSVVAGTYYRYLQHRYRDKLTNLVYIRTAIATLTQKNIPFFMTYMDDLLFESDHDSNPGISDLQDHARPVLHNYQGLNFIEWSQQQSLPVSKALHPLEAAHRAAADYWLPQIQSRV